MNTSRTRTCRLCGEARPLRMSHVVPEFMYRSMYDDKHRMLNATIVPRKVVQVQKGMRERMLCDQCETKLSKGEKYVCEAVLPQIIEWLRTKQDDRLLLSGLDYPLVRLCYLSILWRMSESTLPFFQHVDLGPLANRLQSMLIAGEAGEPKEFGFFCIGPMVGGEFIEAWMLEPTPARIGTGGRAYRCVMGGLSYTFYVSRETTPNPRLPAFIQKNGEWLILRKNAEEMPYLARAVAATDNLMRDHLDMLAGGRIDSHHDKGET